MIARMLRSGLTALAVLGGGAAQAQIDTSPLGARGDLPFSRTPSNPIGPPRSMGEEGFNQTLPPSDRATQFQGPPRSMGELPDDLTILPGTIAPGSPLRRAFPEISTDVSLMPDLLRSQGASAVDESLPDSLLLIPGLFGGMRPEVPGGEPSGEGLDLSALTEALLPAPPRINDQPPQAPLTWEAVRISSERSYPPFLARLESRAVADGEVLSALGSFDLGLSADSRNYPLGYYSRTVQDVFVEQPIRDLGAKIFSGYRVGTGTFPSYYLNLQTREGGAFVNGFELPLLRNFQIDAKRAKLYKAEIERQKVEPTIQKDRIKLLKEATKMYWMWVGAGHAYAINQDLAQVTDYQFRAVEAQLRAGRVSPIALIAFQNILIKRKQQLVQANRAFQNATINLSLYVRDDRGFPLLPVAEALPIAFPKARQPDETRFLEDLAIAMELRPDLRAVDLELAKARVDRRYAGNQYLPSLTFYVYTEQNVGDYVKNLGPDFRPFIMESSLLFEVPVQRRYARGLIRSADAVIRQVNLDRRYVTDTIRAEVQDAYSMLRNAYDDLQLYRSSEVVTRQLELAERKSLEAGRSNSLLLFVREQSTFDIQILRILAEAKYFSALAEYRAALGLDAVPPQIEASLIDTATTTPAPLPSPSPDQPVSSPPSMEREAREAGVSPDAIQNLAAAPANPAEGPAPDPNLPAPRPGNGPNAPAPNPGGNAPANPPAVDPIPPPANVPGPF